MRCVSAAVALASLLLVSCASAPTQPSSAPAPAVVQGPEGRIGEEIFVEVNAQRSREGRDLLSRDGGLDALAQEHSDAMAAGRVDFGHAGLSSRMGTALSQTGAKRGAENVSFQPRAASEVAPKSIERWMGSAAHRKNILGPYGQTGIGVAQAADGSYFVTQLFVE